MKAKSKSVSYFLALSIFVTFACSLVKRIPSTAIATETALPTKTSESPQVLLSPNSLPLPNGLILNSATDTERDISSYQVAYLEDAADGFSGANQSEIDMYFGENHNFSVHVNSSEGGGLVWATGWCAQGQETLSQNLKKIQFEMAVNGQPVDLNQVYKVDDLRSWHTSGNICFLYRIIVSGFPSGTTTLTSKTIINEPVNDGIKDYPTGELTRTYEVINSAETNQSPSSPILGSIEETQKAQDEKVDTLTKAAEEKYSSEFLVGETRNYTIHAINSDRHLRWYQGWCAKSDNILAQNLKNMKFDLQVNGQLIDLDKKAMANYFKDSDGLSCFSYSIVMYGWSSGSTLLTSKIVFLTLINDGISDYKAGEMTKIFTVINP